MKKSLINAVSLIIMSSLMLSACSSGGNSDRTNREDDDDETPVSFNTSIDYEELEQCSFDEEDMNADYRSYSFELMNQVASSSDPDTNIMVSPASVMFALDMCASGANGNTLRQMTDLFSEGADPLEQQAFASQFMRQINDSEGVEFHSANSVWTNESRMSSGLNPDFQDYIEEYFDAEAVLEEFDGNTVNEINSWVEEHTSGMIQEVLDELPARTVAVLVNAISFEGQWATPYEDYQVNEFDFRSASGDSIPMDMLCETSYSYYETDLATGFMKSYEGGRYAFLVMLPTDESINANEFLSGFTADDYNDFINSCSYDYDVYTRLPEFESDYDMSLVPVLESMGMTDAFDENLADFTGIGIADSGNNIYISQVLHKTHIELDREGTRAAASTVIIMEDAACAPVVEDMIRYVYCDRPFAYAIVDTSNMNPVFIGTFNGQ